MFERLALRFLLLGLALMATLAVAIFRPAPFDAIDSLLNDWRLRLVVSKQVEERIVIVDVDERSLAKEGAWPWARPKIASLLQILLDDYKVAGVAVDMVFPEQRPDEASLAEQFSRPEVTGSVVYDLLGKRDLPAVRARLPAPPPLDAPTWAPLAQGLPVVANHAGLATSRAGHITPYFDDDGLLRRVAPVICVQRKACRPVLGLAAYAGMLEQPRLRLAPGEGLLAPAWTLTLTSARNVVATIPLTDDGSLIVPYRHRGDLWMRTVSASDILEHKGDPDLLKGVMVLLGGSALGLADVISTPMNPLAGGFESHAEILSSLLDNEFLIQPSAGLWLDVLVLLPFAVVFGWALGRFDRPAQRAAVFPLWLLLTWGGTAAVALYALAHFRLLLPLLPLVLFPPLALLLAVLAEIYRSRSANDGLLTVLATYLPRSVANRLAGSGVRKARADGVMDATRRTITVLFADIHGFAGITEDRPPEVVARLMQKVFHEMADAVVTHGGTIDKFIGDAIMAFWNAPEDDPRHAEHALACAIDIHRRMEGLRSFCAELGLPSIRIGVGIESGLALVGNFGSSHRRTFTALGEPVVLASRLEGLTKQHNEAILVGPGCAAVLGNRVRELCTESIRGRIHPLTLYIPQ